MCCGDAPYDVRALVASAACLIRRRHGHAVALRNVSGPGGALRYPYRTYYFLPFVRLVLSSSWGVEAFIRMPLSLRMKRTCARTDASTPYGRCFLSKAVAIHLGLQRPSGTLVEMTNERSSLPRTCDFCREQVAYGEGRRIGG